MKSGKSLLLPLSEINLKTKTINIYYDENVYIYNLYYIYAAENKPIIMIIFQAYLLIPSIP